MKLFILHSFSLGLSLLDLQNKIGNKMFFVDLFDSYPFNNVRMLYKYSNLLSNMFWAAKRAETLCIAKASNIVSFYSFVKPLIFGMIKQEAHNDKFSNAFKAFLSRHQIFLKDKAQDRPDLLYSIF